MNTNEQQTMHKIAYNNCCGAFELSRDAILWLGSHGIYDKYPGISNLDLLPRHEPLLIQCIQRFEELGEDVNDNECSDIRIEEIDSDMYSIVEYDGAESVITTKDMIKIEQ